MKKIATFIIATMMTITAAVGPAMASAPAFANVKCVITTTIGNKKCDAEGNPGAGDYNCSCEEEGSGEAIKDILKLVVNIMSVGVGILAILGIIISGIQYLTAGGNEEKTRKAKRRILEIVIGLAAYVLIYGLLFFLIPGFSGVDSL